MLSPKSPPPILRPERNLKMQHANWIAQARAHWKEHLPAMYRRLLANGTLESELKAAAEATSREMEALRNEGATATEAWEMVRERYLLLPEEPGQDEPMEPSDGYAAALDVSQSLGSLTMPGEKED